MGVNLTDLYIDQTFQKLVQIDGQAISDGTGSAIPNLDVTASHADNATSASRAQTARSADREFTDADGLFGIALIDNSGDQVLKYGDQPRINPSTGEFVGNLQGTASYAEFANNTTTASYAQFAGTAGNATKVSIGGGGIDVGIVGAQALGSSQSLVFSGPTMNATDNSISASIFKGDLQGNATTATNATTAEHAQNTVITVKNLESTTIIKGTPLFITDSGTSGNVVGVYRADASNPARMPAGAVAGESLAPEAEGLGYLDGFIQGVNTQGFTSGQAVYVGVGGGYQATRPTGSNVLVQALGYIEKVSPTNGSGVIQGSGRANDVPNIQQGYMWVGGFGDVATTVSSASFAKVNENNVFTGTQTFDNIAVNGTGSFAYIQSVTGSAKIIGDAFIILNNDTPAERYAGIIVQDSGSGSPLTTASFQFDGQTNDWFYEYSNDGGATTDHGVAIFGPEYDTKGNPTYLTNNSIPKSAGNHHIVDSSIIDDGALVTINNPLTVTGQINGNLNGNAATATTASYALNAEDWDGQYTGSAGIQGTLGIDGRDVAGVQQTLEVRGSTTTGTVIQTLVTGSGVKNAFQGAHLTGVSPNATIGFQFNATDINAVIPQIYFDDNGNGSEIISEGNLNISSSTGVARLIGTASHANQADTSISASYAAIAGNAGDWDGQYLGSAGITGSLNVIGPLSATGNITATNGYVAAFNGNDIFTTVGGNITNNVGTLANNTEKDLVQFGPVTDTFGNTYNLAHNLLANYPGFGPAYKGSWGVEFWDSYGYNFGNEYYIAPTITQYNLVSQQGGFGRQRIFVETSGTYTGDVKIENNANSIFFQSNGDRPESLGFLVTNPSGSAAASSSYASFGMGQSYGDPTRSSYSVQANDINFGNFGPNSGNTRIFFGGDHAEQIGFQVGNVNSFMIDNGSAGITGSINYNISSDNFTVRGDKAYLDSEVIAQKRTIGENYTLPSSGTVNIPTLESNFFNITPTGTVTIGVIDVLATNYSQTINIRIDNTGGHTVNWSGVKWSGGTPPTLSTGTHIVTLVRYGTDIYATAVENLS